MKKLKVLYMGTPEFAVPSLEVLTELDFIELIAVISMPDRPSGRGQKLTSPPVVLFAKERGLKVYQTNNINKEDSILDEFEELEIDAVIVLAFAQFLGERILKLPKFGCFNIHTSLLPKYRGAAPIQYALLNGDRETGVTIQKMVKQMDAGDIYFQSKIEINNEDNLETLSSKLKLKAAESLKSFLTSVYENIETLKSGRVQEESEVSFAPIISKNDGFVDFANETSEKIINKFRGYFGWPGIYTYFNRKRVVLTYIQSGPIEAGNLKPEELVVKRQSIVIGTKDGSVEVLKVKPQGKPEMDINSYINGLPNKELRLEKE